MKRSFFPKERKSDLTDKMKRSFFQKEKKSD